MLLDWQLLTFAVQMIDGGGAMAAKDESKRPVLDPLQLGDGGFAIVWVHDRGRVIYNRTDVEFVGAEKALFIVAKGGV